MGRVTTGPVCAGEHSSFGINLETTQQAAPQQQHRSGQLDMLCICTVPDLISCTVRGMHAQSLQRLSACKNLS